VVFRVGAGRKEAQAVSGDLAAVKRIRATHHYAFRSGEWADLLTTVEAYGRPCYLVEFPDGVTDFWPVDDADHGYEFSEE
jgi:hypothetical protein